MMMEASILMISSSAILLDKDPIVTALGAFPASLMKPAVLTKPAATSPTEIKITSVTQREAGDQVNGFLLCTLVSESAKRIKARANRSGVSLPMTMITRCVLRTYHLAAKDHFGPFAKAALDVAALLSLDGKILKDVLAQHTQAKVKNGQGRPRRANQLRED
jgi:hypothetical protein